MKFKPMLFFCVAVAACAVHAGSVRMADVADQEFTAEIADANGKVFLSYKPVGPDPHEPLPP